MKRNEKILEAKQSENTVYLFRFGWKQKIRSENKRNEAKKNFFWRERAKCMRNGSGFSSFRFEAKKFLKRNRAHPSCGRQPHKAWPRLLRNGGPLLAWWIAPFLGNLEIQVHILFLSVYNHMSSFV
jgi:hypothetical protein